MRIAFTFQNDTERQMFKRDFAELSNFVKGKEFNTSRDELIWFINRIQQELDN